MKKSITTIFLAAILVVGAFAAQKTSPSVTGSGIVKTNAYTTLNWNFGTLGRNYVTNDTVTFVSDSVNGIFVQSRDFGPMARNSTSANLYLPDSMHFCIEAIRTDADDDAGSLSALYSMYGGVYVPFGTASTITVSTTRTLFCTVQPFVPGTWLKPTYIVTAATDTPKVYSAVMWSSFK